MAGLFYPRSVAVIGASRDPQKWGFTLVFNILKGGYKGRVFPVNPREKEILGVRVYPGMAQLPEPVDMVAGYRKGDLITTLELFLKSDRYDGVLMLGLGWRTVRGSLLVAEAKSPEDGMAAAGRDWVEEEKKIFAEVQALGRRYGKPILLASDVIREVPSLAESVRARRVAAYPTLLRAVKAYEGLVRRSEIIERFKGLWN